MKKLFLMIVSLLIVSGCVKKVTETNISENFSIPQKFRNEKFLKAINDNASKEPSYKDPFVEMSYLLPDENLKVLLDKASTSNPDILILDSRIRAAKHQLKANIGNLAPKVSGSISANMNGNDKDMQQYSVGGGLTLSWEIDLFGKLSAAYLSQKEMISYARENYINGKVVLAADVANYYFSIQKAYAQTVFAEEIVKNYEEVLKVYDKLRAVGVIDAVQYLDIVKEYLRMQNNMFMYKKEVENNRNALNVLISDPTFVVSIEEKYDTFFEPIVPNLSSVPVDILLNRPDIRSAIYNLNSELYKEHSKFAETLPSLSISSSIDKLFAAKTGPLDFLWSVGANLISPLINRQALYAAYYSQKEAVVQTRLSLEKSLNMAIGDVENASYSLMTAKTTLQNTRMILDAASRALVILDARKITGLVDEINYLIGKSDYLNANISFYSAWYDYIRSSIDLYKAFGGSFHIPTKPIMTENNKNK